MARAEPLNDAAIYEQALEQLERVDRRLALAAQVVNAIQPGAAEIGSRLIRYTRERYRDCDPIAAYAARARSLFALQERFDAHPGVHHLGDPDLHVSRDHYDISLLLSIAFTNHRFEIMQQLEAFVAGCEGDGGRIVSIGTGTGYEIERIARGLPDDWRIESYDIEESVQADARALLDYFGVARPVTWGREFPLEAGRPDLNGRYDAIVMCELLEHLPDPAAALRTARVCLKPSGRMFVTMAVNVAQEDHVYWYPDIRSCRAQIAEQRLRVVSEWITPQTTLPPPQDRESAFKKGNYVAVLAPA
jgi:2-polyprenyl-3-methyl-5-hydroxy-6-metoxy-1,4-benzoquinol methylase